MDSQPDKALARLRKPMAPKGVWSMSTAIRHFICSSLTTDELAALQPQKPDAVICNNLGVRQRWRVAAVCKTVSLYIVGSNPSTPTIYLAARCWINVRA